MQEKNEFDQILGPSIDNWLPAKKPDNAIMQGQYCILEPIDIGRHAASLFNALSFENQGESWTYLPYGPFYTCDEFIAWLQKIILEEKDTELYAILDTKSQLPVGIAGYLRINPTHGVIEIGHVHFSKLLKRTPAATEAMYLMMHKAFEELGYRRYEWKCNALNQASRDAALRFQFKFEGIFRQSYVFKNRNRDTAWFSIIDSEWPVVKGKFERWLNPSNFDGEGNQILSLKEI